MSFPPGENPPRPDDQSEPTELLLPQRPEPGRSSQANLWADAAQTSSSSTPPGADEAWSRGRPSDPETGMAADGEPPVGIATRPDDGADDAMDDADGPAEAAPTKSGGVRARRVAWELVQTLVLAALIFLMVRGVAQNFRVEGPSMEPGLHNGQYLLVNKAVYFKLDLSELSKYIPFIDGADESSRFLFHGPERGDVIVFRYPRDPSRDFIKRIIGVPGDTVSIADGVVTVNGAPIDEPYINGGANSDLEPKVVPDGSYFVLGDNRPNSSDSRNWGFVPEENIIGKAMFSYWPLSEFGGVGNQSIDLGFVKVPLF
jgi:signal peptidase I